MLNATSVVALCAVGFLLTASQQSHANSACLSDQRIDNQVSGKVVYVKTTHPANGLVIDGYKILLLRPRCFEYQSVSSEGRGTVDVTELQLIPWSSVASPQLQNHFFKSNDKDARRSELDQFLRPRIGTFVTVKGEMQNFATAYYIAVPQIVIDSISPCISRPKAGEAGKCRP